jgi:hypothetical protein
MLIACLGWGSLVWQTGELPVRGKWFTDGPFLPIEFARQSENGRLTLVLLPKTFALVRSLWNTMSVNNLRDARKALGKRECPNHEKPESCVDYWPRGGRNSFVFRRIGQWAKRSHIDAVVWTNLPPRFNNEENRIPTAEEAVTYLRGLQGEKREKAEQYIRMTPKQVDTDCRRRVAVELGWGCQSTV